jgi:D-alanyl-D-alanine carboxypeptidase
VKGVGETQVKHTIRHTDRLLESFLNQGSKGFAILGSKTGHLFGAGYNLVAKVKKGEQEIIVMVLGSATSETRFQEIKGLAWWGFENSKL